MIKQLGRSLQFTYIHAYMQCHPVLACWTTHKGSISVLPVGGKGRARLTGDLTSYPEGVVSDIVQRKPILHNRVFEKFAPLIFCFLTRNFSPRKRILTKICSKMSVSHSNSDPSPHG